MTEKGKRGYTLWAIDQEIARLERARRRIAQWDPSSGELMKNPLASIHQSLGLRKAWAQRHKKS
jgi:hypothetical protein